MELIKDYLPIGIAFLGLVISVISLRRTRISAKKERKIQVATHVHTYYKDIRKWAEETIAELSEAAFLCELDPKRMPDGEFYKKRRSARARLSTLLDQGRLFLPNLKHDIIGTWKECAYRGLRPAALDYLSEVYDLVESLDYKNQTPNKPKRKQIVDAKRKFVSEIQDILDVRRTTKEVRRLAQEIQEA